MRVPQALPWLASVHDQIQEQLYKQRLGHALLFTGQAGLGKRLYLRELSQVLLCSETEDSPCGQCANCHLFNAGSHPDLLMVEPEEKGKQIKIEQIRKVTEFVNTTAQKSTNKVVLLGPAEAMNVNASNALLKSLEEPSAHVTLLLYSHQPSGLLATIKSRCQQYSVYPPEFDQALSWVQKNSEAEISQANIQTVLRLSSGAPLRALEFIEEDIHVQYMQFCQNMVDVCSGQAIWSELLTKWKNWDVQHVLQWFYHLLLDAQKQKSGSQQSLALAEMSAQTKKVSENASFSQLEHSIERLLESQKAFRSQANPNTVMMIEALLIDWLALMGQSSK